MYCYPWGVDMFEHHCQIIKTICLQDVIMMLSAQN